MEKQRSKQSSGATVGHYFKMLPAGPGTPWTALLGNSEQMPLQYAENWPEYLSIMGKKLQIRTVQYSVRGNLDGAISGGCRYRFLVVYLTPVRIAQWVGPVLETCKERRPAFVTQPYKGQSSTENSIHNPIPWRTPLKHLCKRLPRDVTDIGEPWKEQEAEAGAVRRTDHSDRMPATQLPPLHIYTSSMISIASFLGQLCPVLFSLPPLFFSLFFH